MLEVPPTPPPPPTRHPPPPPQMDRSQSMSANYKIATGQFLFCLDKAAVLNDFPRSAFILDRTASVRRNKAYSCLFCSCFVFLAHTDQIVCIIVRSKDKTKNPTETAEKTIKTTSYIANEAKISNKMSLITVCKGESSCRLQDRLFCQHQHRGTSLLGNYI